MGSQNPGVFRACLEQVSSSHPSISEGGSGVGMGTQPSSHPGASVVAQSVKNLPATQETQFLSLGRDDPLEKGMATHSITLAWRIPWTEEPGGLQSMGVAKSRIRFSGQTPTAFLPPDSFRCC